MPLSPEDARYSAAYQIVFERCNPDNCVSEERLREIEVIADKIVKWADHQSPDVLTAYIRAVREIIKRAEARYENHVRYNQLIATRKALPEPPADF